MVLTCIGLNRTNANGIIIHMSSADIYGNYIRQVAKSMLKIPASTSPATPQPVFGNAMFRSDDRSL
jgi:hypothetical protein